MHHPRIVISIVSHRQGKLVRQLLQDLERFGEPGILVIVTVNVSEPLDDLQLGLQLPIKIVRNAIPLGFGANHNAAFRLAAGDYFCVANPDIRLFTNPFSTLIGQLGRPDAGVAAPLVVSPTGELEDSARRFPTCGRLVTKAMNGLAHRSRPDYGRPPSALEADWVAGMFMLFRSPIFQKLNGFDERYFLYYEDVDLCARLRLSGYRALLDPTVAAVHDARRSSHHNPRYAWWHARSVLRWLMSDSYRQLRKAHLL